jgi:hypothetical protein
MTGPRAEGSRAGWRAALPEISIAAILTTALTAAGYALAGLAGAGLVILGTAAAALIALRGIMPQPAAISHEELSPRTGTTTFSFSFTGFWRKRAGLADGTRSMAAYDAELRGTLQNLLAARLAEHHGISLHEDPAAARRLLCPGPRDDRLWYWIDPARPPTTNPEAAGISPRTLASLINRLERL